MPCRLPLLWRRLRAHRSVCTHNNEFSSGLASRISSHGGLRPRGMGGSELGAPWRCNTRPCWWCRSVRAVARQTAAVLPEWGFSPRGPHSSGRLSWSGWVARTSSIRPCKASVSADMVPSQGVRAHAKGCREREPHTQRTECDSSASAVPERERGPRLRCRFAANHRNVQSHLHPVLDPPAASTERRRPLLL